MAPPKKKTETRDGIDDVLYTCSRFVNPFYLFRGSQISLCKLFNLPMKVAT